MKPGVNTCWLLALWIGLARVVCACGSECEAPGPVGSLCSIGVVLSFGKDTRACGGAPCPISPQHTTDPAEKEIDHQAPGVAQITGVEVTRGEPTPSSACGAAACPSIGGISVEIAPASDDRTAASQMGYLLILEGGVSFLMDDQVPLRAVENRINSGFSDEEHRGFGGPPAAFA
ncbi:MAG: hypothetical protein GYA21_00295 [Myxococcales bacterium]|nr:hypothetical protein [Myxococcales bacterium]